jgi:DNA replicative helicase MCM subunit Mcm2 (Cdc46/Mcm family)
MHSARRNRRADRVRPVHGRYNGRDAVPEGSESVRALLEHAAWTSDTETKKRTQAGYGSAGVDSEVIAQNQSSGDLPARLMMSFHRLIAASARAHDRSTAREQDVLEAAEFIRRKLTYFGMLGPERKQVETTVNDVRQEQYERHAGKVVHVSDLVLEMTRWTLSGGC